MKCASPQQQLAKFMARFEPEIARLGHAALRRMRELAPGAVELVYDNYNGLVIGFGPTERASEAVFSVVIYPKKVSLCFIHGAKLPNPKRLLEGNGNQVRHISLPTIATLDEPDVVAMIQLANDRVAKPIDFDGKRRLIIKSISRNQRPRRAKLAASAARKATAKPRRR